MNMLVAIWCKLTPYLLPVIGVLIWLAWRGDVQWALASKVTLCWIGFGAGIYVSAAFWDRW